MVGSVHLCGCDVDATLLLLRYPVVAAPLSLSPKTETPSDRRQLYGLVRTLLVTK